MGMDRHPIKVTEYVATTNGRRCANCNRRIRKGEIMLTARCASMALSAHKVCPVQGDGAIPARALMQGIA